MTRQKCFAAALLLLVFCAGCKKIWPDKLYYTIQFDTDGGETYSYTETLKPVVNSLNPLTPRRYIFGLKEQSFTLSGHSDKPYTMLYQIEIRPEHVDFSSIIDGKRYVIDTKKFNKNYDTEEWLTIDGRGDYALTYGEFSFEKCKIEESDLSFSFFFECSMIKLYGHSTTDTLHISNGKLDVYKTLCEDNHYIVDNPQ